MHNESVEKVLFPKISKIMGVPDPSVERRRTMKCNVGGTDRLERIFHGIVFLLVAVFF